MQRLLPSLRGFAGRTQDNRLVDLADLLESRVADWGVVCHVKGLREAPLLGQRLRGPWEDDANGEDALITRGEEAHRDAEERIV